MDIEEVASKTPEKIITTRVSLENGLSVDDIKEILNPYHLPEQSIQQAET